jgi:hypothetical protein
MEKLISQEINPCGEISLGKYSPCVLPTWQQIVRTSRRRYRIRKIFDMVLGDPIYVDINGKIVHFP